jgi:hypothetical protein
VNWSGIYDAVLNRFAFHDPLPPTSPRSRLRVTTTARHPVTGWWSNAARDPPDKARSNDSLHELLETVSWRLLAEWETSGGRRNRTRRSSSRKALGLTTADRWSSPRPLNVTAREKARPPLPGASAFVPMDNRSWRAGHDGLVGVRRRRPASVTVAEPCTCVPRACTVPSTACR